MSGIEAEELRLLLATSEPALGELRFAELGGQFRMMGPGDATDPAPADPDAFRRFVRMDACGRYRPLTGATGLRPGWFVDCASLEEAAAVVEIVYPLALRHRAQHRAGELRVVDADTVLSRQTSRYAGAGTLAGEDRVRAVEALCGRCRREPCWDGAEGKGIPCPEPCSFFVAFAQAIADLDRTDPADRIDPAVPFADFDRPGNEIRCRFLKSVGD